MSTDVEKGKTDSVDLKPIYDENASLKLEELVYYKDEIKRIKYLDHEDIIKKTGFSFGRF